MNIPIEDSGWEKRFDKIFVQDNLWKSDNEDTAYVAIDRIKDFIRAEIASAISSEKARVVAIVENEMRKNEDMYGMTPINLTMDCIKEKLK